MIHVTLTIHSSSGKRQVPLTGRSLSFGRGEAADVRLDDRGLSRLHATVHVEGGRVWIVDEGSTNGSFVNGQAVPPSGAPLKDGDRVTIGDETIIQVSVSQAAAAQAAVPQAAAPTPNPEPRTPNASSGLPWPLISAAALIAVIVIGAVGVGAWIVNGKQSKNGGSSPTPRVSETADLARTAELSPTPVPDATTGATTDATTPVFVPTVSPAPGDAGTPLGSAPRQLYLKMSAEEQRDFVYEQAQEVARKIGNRESPFTEGALDKIKYWVDAFARRVGNNQRGLWREDFRFLFRRAATLYTPQIIHAFKEHKVPHHVGVYLPMIETEYNNISSENFAGAMGLFQFIPGTAQAYGVNPAERTNIEKMAPAAAKYIRHRMTEFGPDAVGVALGIAGYNRSPDSVRRDLQDLVLKSKDRDRNFWKLIENKELFDHYFQNENINYVPRFFAAAIIGENPRVFGLKMRALSTYTEPMGEGELE
jgi:hypothetical protein